MSFKTTIHLAATCLMAWMLTACSLFRSTEDNISYFQNLDQIPDSLWNQPHQDEIKLRAGHELNIVVNADDMAAVASYNKTPITASHLQDRTANTLPSLQTYRIDHQGNLDMPTVGRLHVEGMTISQLRDELQRRVAETVVNPIVSVELLSFRVMVMGEVNKPGVYPFTDNRISIMEALSAANDLTIYGDRKSVVLIRDNNGQLERNHIDLTKADIFLSDCYYVKPGDVIYVAPNKARRDNARYNSMNSYNISVMTTIISCVSVLATVAIAIWR